MAKDAATLAKLWADKMTSSVDKYKNGITSTTVNPMEMAAQAVDRMLAGFTHAATSGKIAARLRAKSVADWKQAATTTGADRLASGARAAIPKMQAHLSTWLPVAADIKATAASMPKNSIEDAVARVRMAITKAKQYAASKGG